eukprot:GILI01036596.1.p1 GENE.GILI01036596.1~~GILI01036596.1.p1  ORF type:complete len:479 (-),score=112.78 GILI01036596.1:39-1475(-)
MRLLLWVTLPLALSAVFAVFYNNHPHSLEATPVCEGSECTDTTYQSAPSRFCSSPAGFLLCPFLNVYVGKVFILQDSVDVPSILSQTLPASTSADVPPIVSTALSLGSFKQIFIFVNSFHTEGVKLAVPLGMHPNVIASFAVSILQNRVRGYKLHAPARLFDFHGVVLADEKLSFQPVQCQDGSFFSSALCFSEMLVSLVTIKAKALQQQFSVHSSGIYFVVPEDHLWVWPTVSIGHKVVMENLYKNDPSRKVVMTTLSHAPKVFLLEGFMDDAEVQQILAEGTVDMFRSTVGPNGDDKSAVIDNRSSSTKWVMDTPIAVDMYHRSFELIRKPYVRSHADGLQVLRYDKTQRYNAHFDYFDRHNPQFKDWEVVQKGHNRFATVLLYLSDVEGGGHTVFPLSKEFDPAFTANPAEASSAMPECGEGLAVQPKKGLAVLFYSLHGDHTPDKTSLHGACPVTSGVKYAVNNWIWNNYRYIE